MSISGYEGARRANEDMHRKRLEDDNRSIEDKLDKIISLLDELIRLNQPVQSKFISSSQTDNEIP